jgi:hypothetical protein
MSLIKPNARPAHAAFESLEGRTLFNIAVFAGTDLITNGNTLAASHPAYFDYGFVRQGSADEVRSIAYNVRNQSGTNLHVTGVTVPAGFEVVAKPSPTADLPEDDFDSNLTIRLNKNVAGKHQGNVVIQASDGSTFKFEITGTVGSLAATGAYNLGSVGTAHRTGSIAIASLSDGSGTAVLTPVVNLYRFDLTAPRNAVTLDLLKPAGSDEFGVSMKIFRDANADGVLQVGEEQEIFPATQVDGIGAASGVFTDSASGSLAAGAYLIKCAPTLDLGGANGQSVAYDFTLRATPQAAPQIAVQAVGKAAVTDGDLTTSSDDGTYFGSAPAGSIARRDFIITNKGSAPLTLNPAAFLTASNGFSIDAGLPPTLAPGGTARLGIRMLTTGLGSKSAQVVIPTNDPDAPQFNFNVSGKVAAGQPTSAADAPTASLLTAVRVRNRGGTFYKFMVRYSDSTKVDASTLDGSELTITGPGGFSSGVRLLSQTPKKGGRRLDVLYRLAARGGDWDRSDNGLYTINLNGSHVADLDGHTSDDAVVGQFTVIVPKKSSTTSNATPAAATFSTKRLTADDGAVAVWN